MSLLRIIRNWIFSNEVWILRLFAKLRIRFAFETSGGSPNAVGRGTYGVMDLRICRFVVVTVSLLEV